MIILEGNKEKKEIMENRRRGNYICVCVYLCVFEFVSLCVCVCVFVCDSERDIIMVLFVGFKCI